MENKLPIDLQEVIFGSSNPGTSKRISSLERSGKIKKIAPRLYTTNINDDPTIVVRRNMFTILGKLFPGAVLSHRSAFEFQPTTTDQLFLTYKYTRRTQLPGVTLRFLKGSEAIEGDNALSGALYASQKARAFLENLPVSRRKGPNSKILRIEKLEEELEQMVRTNGEIALNELRDSARSIATKINMGREFQKLDSIISALLSTQSSSILKSTVATARAFGYPFDPSRYQLLEKLFRTLKQANFKTFANLNKEVKAFKNFAFFEAYFSNYIEGTIFGIDEAKHIVESQKPVPNRHQDSHDILGTYQIVSSKTEMQRTAENPEELISILKYRHKILMSARPDKLPGQFKNKNNFAGQTAFVQVDLVLGTLIKGFEFYNALVNPFARAAYIMFLVSEVHPFLDGNGRIARIMMNAELTTAEQWKIMIPNVYRDDYVLTLRRLTRQGDPHPYIKMLERA